MTVILRGQNLPFVIDVFTSESVKLWVIIIISNFLQLGLILLYQNYLAITDVFGSSVSVILPSDGHIRATSS